MEEFVNRTCPQLKELLWREHIVKGNDARITSAMYTHNHAVNLIQRKWGNLAIGKMGSRRCCKLAGCCVWQTVGDVLHST